MEIHPYVNRRPGRPLTSSALISMRSFFALFPPHVYELHHHEVFMTREPAGPDTGPQSGPFPYPHPHPRQGYSLFVIRKFFKPWPRLPKALGARTKGSLEGWATRSHWPLVPICRSFPLATHSHSCSLFPTRSHLPLLRNPPSSPCCVGSTFSDSFPRAPSWRRLI